MHPTPARIYDSMMAGPAYSAAADPVSTKIPAPMIAPIPSDTRLTGPNARFSPCSPVSEASFNKASMGFVANNGFPIHLLLQTPLHCLCHCEENPSLRLRAPP